MLGSLCNQENDDSHDDDDNDDNGYNCWFLKIMENLYSEQF